MGARITRRELGAAAIGATLAAATRPSNAAVPRGGFLLRDGQRVLFLGDSITHAGGYIQYVETFLRTQRPNWNVELINLGLSSETVSGLSEPDHPFPRPDLHERLDRALAKVQPQVVFACYGMNDGIYHPLEESRFARFRGGVERLRDRVRTAGAQLVLMTPPPFDPQPLADRVLALGAAKFSWQHPYVGYDEVLAEYGRWIIRTLGRQAPVVDLHTALKAHVALARGGDPRYTLATDGIHPNATGQWLIARELLMSLGAPTETDFARVDAQKLSIRDGAVSDLVTQQRATTFRWTTRLPLPRDPAWDRTAPDLDPRLPLRNQHRLVVSGLPHGRYALWEGERVLGSVTSSMLGYGLDLRQYPDLVTNHRALDVLKLVRQRERLLSAAWLSEVGHTRPQIAPGLPLAEARTQAAALDEQLRQLTQPVTLTFKLVPVG